MAFLEDLGRSNALSSVNNLMDKAIEMRQGEDKSAERAYMMGLQVEELGIHKAAAEREATKFKLEADAIREKQRLQDIPYPVAKYLGADFASDPAKKMMYDKGKELGIIENIGGIDMVREKNFPAFKKYMMDDLEWTATLNATNMSRLQQRAAELESSIPEMKKPEEREAAKGQLKTIYEQIGGLAKTQIAIDTGHQKKKELEKIKGTEAAKIRSESAQDIASLKADVAREIAEIRAAAKAKSGTSDDSKEEKRKVKLLDTSRREVERAYGYSQFLPTAQDPQLIEKVGKSKALVEDIIEHYKDYGFKKEPTPGQAAIRAKDEIEALYKKKNNPVKSEDTKTKTIRELLFGPGNK